MVLEKIAVLKELTIFSVLLRTVLAMVFSGILGYEREKKGRPAGFRSAAVLKSERNVEFATFLLFFCFQKFEHL